MTSELPIEVRGAFQLTFEDYHESVTSVIPIQKNDPRRKINWGLQGWVIFVFLAVMLFWVLNRDSIRRGTSLPPPNPNSSDSESAQNEPATPRPGAPMMRFLTAMSPMILICGGLMIFTLRRIQRPPAEPWVPPEPVKNTWLEKAAIMLMVSAIIGAVLGMAFWRSSEYDPLGGLKPSAVEWGMGIEPIILLIASLIALGKLQQKSLHRTQWAGQPAQHRPYQLQATENGIVLIEPLGRHEYQWEALTGYKETTNLLLVYTSWYAYWMIPKRAFQDSLSLDRFKGLLLNHIPKGFFLNSGVTAFPVVKVAQQG